VEVAARVQGLIFTTRTAIIDLVLADFLQQDSLFPSDFAAISKGAQILLLKARVAVFEAKNAELGRSAGQIRQYLDAVQVLESPIADYCTSVESFERMEEVEAGRTREAMAQDGPRR
jgi:hypothetical protein